MKVFASLFSKSDRDPTHGALVGLRRVRNPPIVRKRHERVNFAKGKRGKTHKWGFSLVSHKCNFNCLPLFFGGKRRKEKLIKETPKMRGSASHSASFLGKITSLRYVTRTNVRVA